MDKLNKSDILKIEILRQFKRKRIDYTASYMSNFVKHKFETVKKALDFFVGIGILEKELKEHGDKHYTYYRLSNTGNILIKSEKI